MNGNPGGSGSGGGGGTGGSKSESSAAIHATAKWSTAQLKKTQAELAARTKAAAEAQAKANRDALTVKKTRILFTLSVDASLHTVFGTSRVNKSGNQINVNLIQSPMSLKT